MKVHVLFSEWTRCSDGDSAVVHGVFANHAAALAEARAVMAQYEGWGHTCYGTCIPDREPKGDHWTFDLYIEEHEVHDGAVGNGCGCGWPTCSGCRHRDEVQA